MPDAEVPKVLAILSREEKRRINRLYLARTDKRPTACHVNLPGVFVRIIC